MLVICPKKVSEDKYPAIDSYSAQDISLFLRPSTKKRDGILSAINPLPSRVIGPHGGDCDGCLLRKSDAV
jgi:hypothetical protein